MPPAPAGGESGPGATTPGAGLRYGNPWQAPLAERDPVRRLRGHMVLPVTVWLAGQPAERQPLTGLTVSSVMLAQGQPPMLAGLVSPDTDLAEAISAAQACFVVHVLADGQQRLAQHFAGQLPAPAEALHAVASSHGPVLTQVTDRLSCRVTTWRDFGWSVLVEAQVEDASVEATQRGLAWYHGELRVIS